MTLNNLDDLKLSAVRLQIEFYFSEGNLPNDKFMKESIEKSSSKSLSIDELLTFNRLRSLGATEEVILRAVSVSAVVEMNEEGSGVRRKADLPVLRSVEGRTVYCGGLDQRATYEDVSEQLRERLSSFGTILRIDIPRYSTSNSLKGFGFVEFLTKTSAKSALKVYKPSDKEIRKASAWKYFSYCNNQYNHALKQLEMLGHPQKLFFEDFLGEQRKLKAHDKLIAIAKKEWLIFRNEFYEAQKCHLTEMKTLINKYQSQQAVHNPCSHKLHERVKNEETVISIENTAVSNPELSNSLICGSIVEFHCGEGTTKKALKTALTLLPTQNNVAYIDFRDFSLSGYLRFKSSETAKEFVKNPLGFVSAKILNPSQEHEYIERISLDKEMKRESQKRKNQKKKNKLSSEVVECKRNK